MRDALSRRGFLIGSSGLAGTDTLAHRLFATGSAPLEIRSVESIVIRSPRGDQPPDWYLEMPPVGSVTGGPGLWNRLDHASPSRFRGVTQATLVKILTQDGLVGWGECHAPAAPRVHAAVISDLLAPILIGQDARQVEPLWEKLYSSQRLRGYATGFFTESIAGIDLALWDLLGKYLGQPLYRILGGKYRDSVPTYAGIGGATTEAIIARAKKALESGFSAVKMGLSKGPGTSSVERVQAVSESIGGAGQLLVDSLGAYKTHEARAVGDKLDALDNIGWWEDALLPEDISGYTDLRARLKTPICVGETLSNRYQFRDLFAARGADMVNPDICRAGGISECRRIGSLADLHGVLFSPHISTGTALYWAASLHLAVHLPNTVIMEGGTLLDRPFGNELLTEPLEHNLGEARVPERAGIGVEFDERELERYRVA